MSHYYCRNARSDTIMKNVSGCRSDESCTSKHFNCDFYINLDGSLESCSDHWMHDDCFLSQEIELRPGSTSEEDDGDWEQQEVTSKLLVMDTEEEDDDHLEHQEVTSKFVGMEEEEEEEEGEEGEEEEGDQGEETSWAEAFAQELASLQDCVEEEGDDLQPNPFYQDEWVSGWKRAPTNMPCY